MLIQNQGNSGSARRRGVYAFPRDWTGMEPMAQLIVSWFIYDGAIRVHAINGVGRAQRPDHRSRSGRYGRAVPRLTSKA
jgi:hypothetical protein